MSKQYKPNKKAIKAVRDANSPVNLTFTNDRGGATQFGRDNIVEAMKLPTSDDAHGRLVRLHERLHACHTNAKRMEAWAKRHGIGNQVSQIVEDIRLHTPPIWRDMPETTNRDLRECLLSEIKADMPKADAKSQLIYAVRAGTILPSLREDAKHQLGDYSGYLESICTGLRGSTHQRIKAAKLFQSLLGALEQPDEDSPSGEYETGDGERRDHTTADLTITIIDLPKSIPCREATARERIHTTSGSRLNVGRAVKLLTVGGTGNIFSRATIQHAQAGTILIDASGSMHVDTEGLIKLCKLLPASTIAFYSGYGVGAPNELVIVARDGIRAKSQDFPREHGGNEIDLFALRWLLDQDGPRTFVTDAEFCGGLPGHAIAALTLFRESIDAGDITWLDLDLPEAIEHYAELVEA